MDYYTSGDIANLLDVSKPTVSNWLARGYIEKGLLPVPEITTISGMRIWNGEQAQTIMEQFRNRKTVETEIAQLRQKIKELNGKA